MDKKIKPLEKEIIKEEYILGKEYYDKLLEKAKEENKKMDY